MRLPALALVLFAAPAAAETPDLCPALGDLLTAQADAVSAMDRVLAADRFAAAQIADGNADHPAWVAVHALSEALRPHLSEQAETLEDFIPVYQDACGS